MNSHALPGLGRMLHLFPSLTGEEDSLLNPEDADSASSALDTLTEDSKEDAASLRAGIRRCATLIAWLEEVGEEEAASIQRGYLAGMQGELARSRNKEEYASRMQGLLAGFHLLVDSVARMQSHYSKAVATSLGNGEFHPSCRSVGAFSKYIARQSAVLQHKTVQAMEGFGWNGETLHSLNGAPYYAALKREAAWLTRCEERAAATYANGESGLLPVDVWQWVNRVSREFRSSGMVSPVCVAACPMGGSEALAAIYGRAHVIHAALVSVATSKAEKAKQLAGHYESAYADHDSSIAQAYVHDETGKRLLAPFPKRPVVSVKNSKKRARVEGLPDMPVVPIVQCSNRPANTPAYDEVQAALSAMNSRKVESFHSRLATLQAEQLADDKYKRLISRIQLDRSTLHDFGIDYDKV